MKILKIQTLRGPNYWSIQRHQLVVVRLDLEDFQVQRDSFYQNLRARIQPFLDNPPPESWSPIIQK